MSGVTSFAEVAEQIRLTISRYTHSLDDGRTDEVVATFCADGSCDIPGLGHHEGSEALTAAYDKVKSNGRQRHLVVNTEITRWDGDEAAATSDLVVLVKTEDGWSVGIVGRYVDVLHRDGDEWRFHSRVAEFAL